jgi:hypothetical protein
MFVFHLDAFDQMVNMFLTHIFYPKIVRNQCEQDGVCGMLSQAGGVWTFEISVGEQMLLQKFVCQNTCLEVSSHCAAHLKVNKPVQCKFVQIILHLHPFWK